MKRVVLLTGILILAFTCFVNAQPFQWTYVSDFVEQNTPHGVVVDGNGNIWVQSNALKDTIIAAPDTFIVCGLHVYDPSGTQIALYWHGNIPGVGADTFNYSGRGISKDNNGNILVACGNLFRVNYTNGDFMNRFDQWPWAGVQALTEAACDDNGYIYIARVVPPQDPIVILDTDFNLYNYALDSTDVISRSLVVSADGKDLFHGGIYPAAGAIHYHSDFGPDATYSTVDTLWGPDPTRELWGQCLDWGPLGNVWIGSYWDVTATPAYQGWYAVDPNANGVFQDSIGVNLGIAYPDSAPTGAAPPGGAYWSPRGVAFWEETNGSWTAYTADFDAGVVKKWTNPGLTGIIVVDNGEALISEFELRQNYPNPFNPTTSIPFKLRNAADVKLVIYNVNGQVVKTLVNYRLQAGSYEYEFNASDMASGNYFYRITVDGQTLTKRMMLLK